jgi:uncharacterized membrane protein
VDTHRRRAQTKRDADDGLSAAFLFPRRAMATTYDRSMDEVRAGARKPWVNVGAAERWGSLAAGGALVALGLRSGGTRGGLMALGGAGLVLRGAMGHCPGYQALDINTARETTREALGGSGGIRVRHAVTINRPLDEVYRFWRSVENLPRFMDHLEAVEQVDTRRSRWRAKGPLGTRVEWEAEIINEVENEVIGWASLPGGHVVTAGSVNFRPAPGGRGTEVHVKLQYDPPAGKAGAAFAKLFGEEPSQQIQEDLRRLKELMEAGEVPGVEGQPVGANRLA